MGLGAGTYGLTDVSVRDRTDEVGRWKLYGLPILGGEDANWDAQQALFDTYRNAAMALLLGQLVKYQYGNEVIVNPVNVPGSNLAQRENKLLVEYYDVETFKIYTYSMPTIALALLTFETDAKDFVSKVTGAQVIAFITAHQAFAVAPETGNATIVNSLRFVGRAT